MKILFLNYEFPPLGGGTGVANQYLLNQFCKNNKLTVDVVTSSDDKYKQEKLSDKVRIIYLDIGKKKKKLHHQTSFSLINYFIKSTLYCLKHKHDYDLVHAFSGLPGGVTAWLSGKPYLISLRGTDVPGYERRFKLLIWLMSPLIKLSWKKAKWIDANSIDLKRLATKALPSLKIKVIVNGVDSTVFYPANKLTINPVILSTARLGSRKGTKYLIQAMPKVLTSFPKSKLLLAGEGVERKSLVQLIKVLNLTKTVKLLGRVEHDDLPAIYRQASLFCLPSLSESFSNSLLEAIASGLPIVATNVGGNKELVSSSNGVLVPPADSQSLAEAIVKLLSDPVKLTKIGKVNRKLAKQYNWSQTAKKYNLLYSKIMEKS